MPIYSYACKDCGHGFEQRQSFTDHALTNCPECEGSLRKLYSSVGVVFKGSGFYRTDSRSEARPATSSAPKPASDAGSKPAGGGASTAAPKSPSAKASLKSAA